MTNLEELKYGEGRETFFCIERMQVWTFFTLVDIRREANDRLVAEVVHSGHMICSVGRANVIRAIWEGFSEPAEIDYSCDPDTLEVKEVQIRTPSSSQMLEIASIPHTYAQKLGEVFPAYFNKRQERYDTALKKLLSTVNL